MKRTKSYLVFLIIAFALVLAWTKSGYLIATGESGLQFYNPAGVAEFYRYTWTEGAIGLPTSYAITSYPFLIFLGYIEKIVGSDTLTQATFFFIMLTLGMIGMFELCHLIFSKEKKDWVLYIVPPLFYIFNLYALVNIWNRLQYTFIFFYSFLPLGMFLYLNGLLNKKYKYAIILNFAMMPFVLAFSSIPLIELIWFVFASMTVFSLLLGYRSKQNVTFILIYFFSSVFFWVVCNAWWLVQFIFVFKNSAYVTTQAYTSSGNSEAFSLLSSQLGNLSYVFRLMHREFFLNIQTVWGLNFLNPIYILISSFIPFLAFLPLALKKKTPATTYFLLLAIITIFFAKGDSPPFGFIFFWIFNHVRLLEAFRNPFEKIGMILPVAYAPLIGYSLYRIREYIRIKNNKSMFIRGAAFISIGCIAIVSFPYWNGLVFYNDYVQVPEYYKTANQYLSKNQETSGPFRAIAVPMSGEGMTYLWGYSGVEVSNGLFTTPFISFSTSIQFFKPITDQVEQILFTHPGNLYQMMQLLNAKYLLRREDINFIDRKITNPKYIENTLAKQIPYIESDQKFGQLNFYKISDEKYLPRVYASNKIILTENENIFNDVLPYANYSSGTIFLNHQTEDQSVVKSLTSQSIIKADLASNTTLKVNKENALSELPTIRSTPDKWSYLLIRLKERIEEWGANTEDKDFLQVNRSSKRLVELNTLINKNTNKETLKIAADNYKEYLDKLNIKWITENTLAKEALLRQYYVLNAIPDSALPEIKLLKEKLGQIIASTQSYPFDPDYYTYRMKSKDSGAYKLLLDSSDIDHNFETGSTLKALIDGQPQNIVNAQTKKQIDLGEYTFQEGEHEVKISKFTPHNLITQTQDNFVLNSGKKSARKEFAINNFNPYEKYQVSFDYFLRAGVMPELQFINDTDIKDGQVTPAFHQTLPIREKFYDWQSYSQVISPNTSARSASIGFSLVSWNNCEQLVKRVIFWENKCQNKQIKDLYTNSSEIIIKNLRVEKVFDSELVAIKNNTQYQENTLPEINFTKINPTRYSVKVQNAQEPFVLVFSEAFHPLWTATSNGQKISNEKHQIANGYANSWEINQKGDYLITISFAAENYRTKGSIITIVTISILLAGAIIFRKKL